MADPSWQRNCDLLAKSLDALARKTSSIRSSTNKLFTIANVNAERETIKQITSSANNNDVREIQDVLKLIERYIILNPSLCTEGAKLTNDAKSALQEFQRSCDAFYKKCIAVEEHSRGKQNSRISRAFKEDSEEEEDRETQSLIHAGESQKVQFEKDLYEELMLERQRETGEIADNVRDIHEIFQHINEMVHDQGAQLETVDGNLSTAERATRNATDQLRRAQQYQRTSSRNKWLLIFVIVMLVIVSLGILLG